MKKHMYRIELTSTDVLVAKEVAALAASLFLKSV